MKATLRMCGEERHLLGFNYEVYHHHARIEREKFLDYLHGRNNSIPYPDKILYQEEMKKCFFGFLINILFESKTGDRPFWDLMFSHGEIDGEILVPWPTDEEQVMKHIFFKSASEVYLEEGFSCIPGEPMTMKMRLITPYLKINDAELKQSYYEAYFMREARFVPSQSEPMVVEEERDMVITDAYWIDEEESETRTLITPEPVTLYVVIEDFIAGTTANLYFEGEDEEGVKMAERSGTIDSEGIVTLPDFKMELVTQEA